MHISDADLEKLAFKHLSQDQLNQTVVATVSGQLEDSALDAIEEHFLACGACVARCAICPI